MILLTSNIKESKTWLNNEFPERLNEFEKVDVLVNSLTSYDPIKTDHSSPQQNHNEIICSTTNPSTCSEIYQTSQSNRTYQIAQHNPYMPPISQGQQNLVNILPGGILVSSGSSSMSHNLYQNMLTNTIANTRQLNVQRT